MAQDLNEAALSALSDLASAEDSAAAGQALRQVRAQLGEHAPSFAPLLEQLCRRATELATLRRLAGSDELTGLANRRGFHRALDRELARYGRGHLPPAVLLLDLDGLKAINDRHGHAAGDRAIQLSAEAIEQAVRSTDVCARFGGDELAVLLPATDHARAEVVADRIREAVEAHSVEGVPLRISVGVAAVDRDGTDPGALLGAADARLYDDKAERKRIGRRDFVAA